VLFIFIKCLYVQLKLFDEVQNSFKIYEKLWN